MKVIKIFLSVAVLISISLLFFSPALAQDKVVFASTAGGTVGFITNVAKAYKIDEKNGINLDIKFFDPAEAEKAVLFKKADVGIFVPISAVRVNLKGNRIRIFRPLLWNHTSILVPKDSPVKKLEDLKGKKLGTIERISGAYTSLAVLLKMMGMDIEKDFRLIISTGPGLMAFLERKEVDAILIWEPLVSMLLARGKAKEVVRVEDMWKQLTGEPMLMVGLGAYQEWIDAHPKIARNVAKTMSDAIDYIRTHPEVVNAEKKSLGYKTDDEAELLKKRQVPIYPTSWDQKIIDNAKFIIKKNVELGLIEKTPEEEVFIILK